MAQSLYAQNNVSAPVQISVANTNLDGLTGAYGVVHTGTSGNDEIDCVYLQSTGTISTADIVRLWLHFQSSNTALATMVDQVAIDPLTPNVAERRGVFLHRFTFNPPIKLPSGWTLRASTNSGNTYNLTAQGVKYT